MAISLEDLNPEQHQAVTTAEGPLLVLSGAGSGKTRVITTRIAWLMQHRSVPPASILALTFTNKAAKEMAERVAALTKGGKTAGGGKPLISTFHAFGVRFLRQKIHLLDYGGDFSIYDEQDQISVVRDIMDHMEETPLYTPATAHFALQQAKGQGITPQELSRQNDSPAAALLGTLYARYQKTLKGMNALDFEDILILSMALAQTHRVEAQRFFSQFQYVMVDEYQDTNIIQYRLLKEITAAHHNLCVVGDDDQSIYGWRGAHPQNIPDFLADHPQVRVVRLERNYRSTGTILEAANQVISNNPSRQPKTLKGTKGQGPLLTWLEGEDEKDEMEKMVTHLRVTKMRTGSSFSDFAVLFRSNFQSRMVEETLRLEGIPYLLLGGTGFYDRKEIKDAIAYLRVIQNPGDEVSLFRVINFPRRNVGKTTQMKVMEYARHQNRPVMDILREAESYSEFSGPTAQSMAHFSSLMDRYRIRFMRENLGDVFREFLGEIGFHEAVAKERKDAKGREAAQGLVAELEQATDHFTAKNPDARLKDYLERVSMFTMVEDSPDPRAQVTLLTVHSAKGLEFPYVYLVGMADDVFPHKRSLQENGLDEERRLAYVAITRAKEQLVFSMAKRRKRFSEVLVQSPSRFLLEIQPELFGGVPPHGAEGEMLKAKKAERAGEARKRFFDQMKKMKAVEKPV
ncbi:MAG: UvrD-helicase domain-containing protein [Deltaproteobacteria bacterium]|nr:UvrD-helicase domain-containing protein [Deltaproteobacteria bacterium]